jgi:hypothetical protein
MAGQTLGKIECEMCGERRCRSLEDTICHVCDKQMILEERMAANAAALMWGNKRRCRMCQGPLGADRYYHCHRCEKPNSRETDCPYERALPNLDGVSTLREMTRSSGMFQEYSWRELRDRRVCDHAMRMGVEPSDAMKSVQERNIEFSVDAFCRALEAKEDLL